MPYYSNAYHADIKASSPAVGEKSQLTNFLLVGTVLALLLGSAPRLAAQALVPDPYYEPANDAVTPTQQARYGALRVRTMRVKEQITATERRGHPLISWVIDYQVYDRQGRPSSQYREGYNSDNLNERHDLSYGPDGRVRSAADFRRVINPADTSELGRNWVPSAVLWYPPATGGKGQATSWEEDTGNWRPQETYRRWTSHDTTYVASYNAPFPRFDNLSRSYYVAGDSTLWRHDELRYVGSPTPVEATYTYVRRNAQRQVLEVGQVAYSPATAPRNQPAEPLARRSTGRLLPRYAYVYDAQGRLSQCTTTGFDTQGRLRTTPLDSYETFTYDAQGRCVLAQYFYRQQPGPQTRYDYLPSGLLQRASTYNERHELTKTLLYEYTYYP